MEHARKRVRPIDGTENLPLPGHYRCITLQVNATFYETGSGVRWVLTSRMPEENIELSRRIGELAPHPEALEGLDRALHKELMDVEYLMGWGKGI